MDEREVNLLKWARDLVARLRRQLQTGADPLKEIKVLCPGITKLQARYDAVYELLDRASDGGHITSKEIIDVIEMYAPWKDEPTD